MAARKLAVGAVTAPLVTGLVVGLTAAPAAAASDDITSPSDDAVVTSGPRVRIAAKLDLIEAAELRLRGPVDKHFHTIDERTGELQYDLDISCPSYDRPCSGVRPAHNGTYTIHVVKAGLLQSGQVEDKQTFQLRVPPERPADVTIRAKGPDTVRLRWDRGGEPDLTAYDVLNASGARVKRVPVQKACNEGKCSTAVEVPTDEAGAQAAYSLRARRSAGPVGDDTVASSPSQPVAVQLPASTQSPEPSAMSSGDSPRSESPGPGRSPGSESTGTQSALPSVQPLASASRLALPDIARKSNRTFQHRLDHPLPMLPTPSPTPRAATGGVQAPIIEVPPAGGGPRSMTAAVQMAPSEWWKTVALGLVLLLVAAHLGAWTWRTRPAPPRANPRSSSERGSKGPASALTKQRMSAAAVASSAVLGGFAKRRVGRRRR